MGATNCSGAWEGGSGASRARADGTSGAEPQEAAQVQAGPEGAAEPQCAALPLRAALIAAQVWAACRQACLSICRVRPPSRPSAPATNSHKLHRIESKWLHTLLKTTCVLGLRAPTDCPREHCCSTKMTDDLRKRLHIKLLSA